MDILHEEQRQSIHQVQGIQRLDKKLHREEDQDFSIGQWQRTYIK